MLGHGQRSQRPVEGFAGERDQGLLREKSEVHLPNARHLVEKDQGTLEKSIDFDIFLLVDCWIFGSQVLDAQFQILSTCQMRHSVRAKPEEPTTFHSL